MKRILHILPFVVLTFSGFSQNVGINSTGSAPNSSAMLDVVATDKGILIPRVTAAQKAAMNPLPASAQGLVVYQTDGTQGFYYNTSTTTTPSWIMISPLGADGIYGGSGSLPGNITVTGGANSIDFTSTIIDGFSVDGTTFSVDAASNRVGIGTTTPSYELDINGDLRVSGNDIYGGGIASNLFIYSDHGVRIDLDNNNDGSASFAVRNGTNTIPFEVFESGNVVGDGNADFNGDLTLSGSASRNIFGPTAQPLDVESETGLDMVIDSDNNGTGSEFTVKANGDAAANRVFYVQEDGDAKVYNNLTVAGLAGGGTLNLTVDNTGLLVAGSSDIGDITSVVAGTGLINGGTTGAVTLDVVAENGLTDFADKIELGGTLTKNTITTGGAFNLEYQMYGGGIFEVQHQHVANGILRPFVISSDEGSVNLLAEDGVGLLFQIPNSGTTATGAAIDAVKASGTDSNSSTELVFKISQNDATLDEAMRIDENGNVGVAQSTPLYKVHSTETTAGGRAIYGENTDATTVDGYGVYGKSVNAAGYGYGGYFEGGYNGVYGLGTQTGVTSTFGVFGEATGTGGNRYGVYGKAIAATTVNYALYGDAQNGTTANYGLYINNGETKITDGNGAIPTRSANGSIATSSNGGTRLWFRTNSTNYYLNSDGTGDYSEYFKSADQTLSVGDIVSINREGGNSVKKSSIENNAVIGVVSKYGTRNNDNQDGQRANDSTYVNIGMLGQLQVKVSTENGSIAPGDPLTISKNQPGVAVKSIKEGRIIGYAMTHYPYKKGEEHYPTHTDAKGEKDCINAPHVMAVIQPTYWTPIGENEKKMEKLEAEIDLLNTENESFKRQLEQIILQLNLEERTEK